MVETASDALRVMVVDDSVIYRKIVSQVVTAIPEGELLCTANSGRTALAKLEREPADLVLLDVEMPEMDGFETLMEIRRRFPETSIVMVSGLNEQSASLTIKALEVGALDFVQKPETGSPEESTQELIQRLAPIFRHLKTRQNLSLSRRDKAVSVATPATAPSEVETSREEAPPAAVGILPERIGVVVIGVSTGGPNALAEVIPRLPPNPGVPILVVQHMPPVFTASLAENLARKSRLPVIEAHDGQAILPDQVLLAPGGRHMTVIQPSGPDHGAAIVRLNDGPPVKSCRPSVDVLFRSVARAFAGRVLAVVMTGMGDDGSMGIRALKQKGCYCLTQSEETCVVYGMPRAVNEIGCSDERVPLNRISERIVDAINQFGIG